ncbi:hypothetical protein E2C01_044989 [Portunus trituberculatus]|uniref:Uncharacterized protein n=1 Tax=Portunus trituberculatus TaxID=210409 RepID=A0A5B7G0W8_PORTR|nr:hypothetical protein [Portunus trituberculatus]
MHIMCCNNFIIQCIPLLHLCVRKTAFSNILHTLPHPDLYMTSCHSIFSMPLTILYIVIKSPHSLLSCNPFLC